MAIQPFFQHQDTINQQEFENTYQKITETRGRVSSLINNNYVNVKNPPYNAKGDGATNDCQAIQAAVDSLPVTGGTVFFPKSVYGYVCSTGIAIPTGKNGFYLLGENKYVTLRFTSTTGNAITIQGEHDNLIIENLDLQATNNSTGYAIASLNTGSSTPLRDFEFRNVNYAYFKSGIVIYGHLNGKIIGGRQGGQGKAVIGGVGIQLGEDAFRAGNGATIENVYISNFEVDLYNKYSQPLSLVGLNLFGGASTAIVNGSIGIVNVAGQINFDSFNDVAINNQGYMNYQAAYSSLGAQSVNTTVHRLFYGGHSKTRIEAYVAGSPIFFSTNSYTIVPFNAAVENMEGFFNTSTYRYTATYPGYRYVDATLQWDVDVSTPAYYQAAIYKNGVVSVEARAWSPNLSTATIPTTLSQSVSNLIWLDKNDYLEIYGLEFESAISSATIHGGAKNCYLSIFNQ